MKIKFTISPAYNNEFITITPHVITIDFNLTDGNHIVTSLIQKIGRLKYIDQDLFAQLSFHYEYNRDLNLVTLHGHNFYSKNSTKITTMLDEKKESCEHYAFNTPIVHDENNQYWNKKMAITPNLDCLFSEIVKNITNQLINYFKKTNRFNIQIKTPPPKLNIEDTKNLMFVYKNDAFLEIYDANKQYEKNCKIIPLESVWGGTVHFKSGENFANVIGSTSDPKIAGLSWIKLWSNQFGTPTICTSYQYQGFNCSSTLVGGHIILGQTAQIVPIGSNNVYIMPICVSHNNNNNVYMAALQYLDGIWLKNYLQ